MVQRPDQRDRVVAIEKLTQPARSTNAFAEIRAIIGGTEILRRQAQTSGKFFQYGTEAASHVQRIVIGREPCGDAVVYDAQALHRFLQGFERVLWIPRRMFLSGESLFFIVADDSGTALARDLDERDASVVESTNVDACQVDRLAARQPFDGLPPPGGKFAC